jgi:hypothetical protein
VSASHLCSRIWRRTSVCLLRRRDTLFPSGLPDVLGTLNTQHQAIDWASLQAAGEQALHVSGTLVQASD